MFTKNIFERIELNYPADGKFKLEYYIDKPEKFGKVRVGDTFIYEKSLYVKVNEFISPNTSSILNAILIEKGRTTYFADFEIVERIAFV